MRPGFHLPNGYHIEDFARVLRLYNPEGALLQEEPRGPAAVPRLQQRAWFDVWEHLEYEIGEELRALREGTRALRGMKRLRQYLRLVDAIEGAPVQAREQVRRSRLVAGFSLAAAAAAVAVTLLTTQPWLARSPEEAFQGGRPEVSSPEVTGRLPAGASSIRPLPVGKSPLGAAGPAGAVPHPMRPARQRPAATYVVGFGEFATRTAAEITMHLIRSKGYVVHVIRIENSYHVLTAPRPQAQAERLAGALQEIGLPARAQIIKAPQI